MNLDFHNHTRRTILQGIGTGTITTLGISEEPRKTFQVHDWKRDPRNPILPPGQSGADLGRCMNPFVLTRGDEYWLYYSGKDRQGKQRICLATCPINDLTRWTRHGPLFDVGRKGEFDEIWCVLPCLHRIGQKWHLYYTGRGSGGEGLQTFTGIGLAVSDDLVAWEKTGKVVLRGDGFERWPGNKGIAGGGTIDEWTQPDGKCLYRMNYTLATGRPGKDLRINQAKQSVTADSYDGIHWFNKRHVLGPREEAAYENAATIALNTWKVDGGWRAIYAGIGTRFGAYSICEAFSRDGLAWDRGKPGENLSLAPGEAAWENKMVEYPHIVEEGDYLRLFYCGNGYGTTGIGTATAERL